MSDRQKNNPQPKKRRYTVVDSDESLYHTGRRSDTARQEERDFEPQRAEIRTRRRRESRDFLGMKLIHPAVFSVVLILIVLFVAVFVFLNAQGTSPANLVEWVQGRILGIETGEGYPIKAAASEAKADNFQLLDWEPALLSDTAFLLYNASGAQISGRQHGYGNPALSAGASRALLYDLGGYGYRLESRAVLDHEGQADRKIFAGTISPNGVYALATAGDGYASELTVYSRNHKKLYTRFLRDDYATSLALRSDGGLLAAAGLRSDGGGVASTLLLLGFNDQEPVAKFEFSDTIIVALRFLRGGGIAVIGDRAAYLIDAGHKNFSTYDYQKHTLQGFSIHEDRGLALALTGADGKSCTLAVVEPNGNVLAEKETEYPCTALDYTGEQIFLLSEDVLLRYSDELALEKEIACPAICKSLLVSGSDCYLLSAGNIWKLDIR